jgi:hypothetical protein
MRQHQSRVISQTARAMIPDLRIMVARSQPRGIAAVAEMLGKINTESQLDRLMAVFNVPRDCELVRRSGRRR